MDAHVVGLGGQEATDSSIDMAMDSSQAPKIHPFFNRDHSSMFNVRKRACDKLSVSLIGYYFSMYTFRNPSSSESSSIQQRSWLYNSLRTLNYESRGYRKDNNTKEARTTKKDSTCVGSTAGSWFFWIRQRFKWNCEYWKSKLSADISNHVSSWCSRQQSG